MKLSHFRSSGAGGPPVNTTSSAIRVTPQPTGMVVESQDERSQYKNKEKDLKVMSSRRREEKQQEKKDAIDAERRRKGGKGDRSERRRKEKVKKGRVTDHRIGLTL